MTDEARVPYAAVRALLQPKLDGQFITNEQLGKAIGLSKTLASYIRNGQRKPRPDHVLRIAKLLFPEDHDAEERDEFIANLNAATEKKAAPQPTEKRSTARADTLTDLRNGLSLSVSSAECLPISGKPDTPFELLASRFLDICGITSDPIKYRKLFDAKSVSSHTLAISTYESAERMTDLKFFRIPFRMSLNGVALDRHLQSRRLTSELLASPTARATLKLLPIVVANSVGWIHCRRRLKFAEGEMVVIERVDGISLEDLLANALVEETDANKDRIPIVCSDELQCLKVLQRLSVLKSSAHLVLPLNGNRAIRESPARREMPVCHLSMAIKRGNPSFQDYLREAWIHFLSTETQTTARLWADLGKTMLAEALRYTRGQSIAFGAPAGNEDAFRWRSAWEWVKHSMYLDRTSIGSYFDPDGIPWQPILNVARDLVQHSLGSGDQSELIGQVQLAKATSRSSSPARAISELCDVFDLDLPKEARAFAYNETQLVEFVRLQLLQEPQLAEVIREYCPDPNLADEEHPDMFATRSVLRGLQGMYEELRETQSVERIAKEIQSLPSLYSSGQGVVLLVSPHDDPQKTLGGVFIRLNEYNAAEAEIRFLFVHPEYRHFGIGSKLLDHAIEFAAKNGCCKAFAEVLCKLTDATALVRYKNFQPKPDRKPLVAGRAVFELELSPSIKT